MQRLLFTVPPSGAEESTFYTFCFRSRVFPFAPLPSMLFFRYFSVFYQTFTFYLLSFFQSFPLTPRLSSLLSPLLYFFFHFSSQCLLFLRAFYRRYALPPSLVSPPTGAENGRVFASCLALRPFREPPGGRERFYLFNVSIRQWRALKVNSPGYFNLKYSQCLTLYPSPIDFLGNTLAGYTFYKGELVLVYQSDILQLPCLKILPVPSPIFISIRLLRKHTRWILSKTFYRGGHVLFYQSDFLWLLT